MDEAFIELLIGELLIEALIKLFIEALIELDRSLGYFILDIVDNFAKIP